MLPQLKEENQQLQEGSMSIFLIEYVVKPEGSEPGAPMRIYDNILHRCVLKALRSVPGAPNRI